MSEDLLRETLRERADQTAYDPTPLGQVAATAHTIRRRRRTTGVLVAAAAVVAVTVPVSVVATRSDTEPAPVEPAPTQRVRTPDPSPTMPVEDKKPPAPRIAYAVDQQILQPNGDAFTPPDPHGIGAFARYDGGYVVADDVWFEASTDMFRYDASGRLVDRWVGSGIAVGTDGTIAWSSFWPPESGLEDVPTLIHRGDKTQEVEQIKPGVVAVLDDAVIYNGGGEEPRAWMTDLVNEPRAIPGLRSASSAADGLVAGQVDDYTAVVLDLATGEELWRAEDAQAMDFSPDGKYLHLMHGGLGQADTIRDARTGAVVTEGIPGTGLSGLPGLRIATWEDETHLLGTLDGDIVRVDLAGEVTVALPLRHQNVLDFVFAAQP